MQLTYAEIWKGIENLAESKGLSLSGLAVKAGLDATSFNKSKRIGADGRKRWPSTESMNKILNATNTTIFEFMELAGEPYRPKPHVIPLLGLAKAGRDGYFDANGYPLGSEDWDGIEFPFDLGQRVYALEVSGNSMEPAYRDGDKLVVSPDAEVRNPLPNIWQYWKLRTIMGKLRKLPWNLKPVFCSNDSYGWQMHYWYIGIREKGVSLELGEFCHAIGALFLQLLLFFEKEGLCCF